MGNRKLPFGYRMEQGKVVIHSQEAEVVTMIFQQYTAGFSYLDLVKALKSQPIPYDIGRLWNKNMVARILEDERYLGKKGCPMILDYDVFRQADQKRKIKQVPSQLTEAQKVFRRLSGQKVGSAIEQQVLELLNGLIKNPENIKQPLSTTAQQSTAKLESELERILETQPIDEEAAKRLIRQIASAKYNAIPSEEYETQRLRHIFSRAEPMEELDTGLLKDTVFAIQIDRQGAVALSLKNHQTIERRVLT